MENEAGKVSDSHCLFETNVEKHCTVEWIRSFLLYDENLVLNLLTLEHWMDIVEENTKMLLSISKRDDQCYL